MFFICLLYACIKNQTFDVVSDLPRQRGDRAHKPGDLPRGRRRSRRDGWPAVDSQDKAYSWRLPSPCHPDPADGTTADHDG